MIILGLPKYSTTSFFSFFSRGEGSQKHFMDINITTWFLDHTVNLLGPIGLLQESTY